MKQDEADLAWLPTLARTWMKQGEQLRIAAPGTNQKRSASAAIDLGEGQLSWANDERRCVGQFCATLQRRAGAPQRGVGTRTHLRWVLRGACGTFLVSIHNAGEPLARSLSANGLRK